MGGSATVTPSTRRTSTGYYTSGGRGYYAGGRPYGYYYGGGAYGRGHTVMIVGMYVTLILTLPLPLTLTLTLTLTLILPLTLTQVRLWLLLVPPSHLPQL